MKPTMRTAMKTRPAIRYRSRLRSKASGSNGGGLGRSRGIVLDFRNAGRALGGREVGVGAAGRTGDQLRCVSDQHARRVVDTELVAVHAAWRRTFDPFAAEVVLGPVTGALEAA